MLTCWTIVFVQHECCRNLICLDCNLLSVFSGNSTVNMNERKHDLCIVVAASLLCQLFGLVVYCSEVLLCVLFI